MKFIYSDGGRSKYFKTNNVNDCVVRAICNATGKDYKEVYDSINLLAKNEKISKRKRTISNARAGVYRSTFDKYIKSLGWKWHPMSLVGKGCSMHLNEYELPQGTLIVRVSKHLTCVKDKVLIDTYDCSRNGERCVYGYYSIN